MEGATVDACYIRPKHKLQPRRFAFTTAVFAALALPAAASAQPTISSLPLPRQAARAAISKVVNFAVVRAAAGVAGITVVRLDQVFTPAGYSDVLRYRGRSVRVREFDGIHLNVQGQAIAGEIVSNLIRGKR